MIVAATILLANYQSTESKAAAKLGKDLSKYAEDQGSKTHKKYLLVIKPERAWKLSTKVDEQLDAEGMWREDVEAVSSVWKKANLGTYVNITYASPSGDWFATEEYAIRTNNQFATATVQFSSFNPFEFRKTETRLFNKTGKLLSKKLAYTTFEDKPLTKSQIGELGDIGREFKLLKSARQLPFSIK